jgi:hypothetical protein
MSQTSVTNQPTRFISKTPNTMSNTLQNQQQVQQQQQQQQVALYGGGVVSETFAFKGQCWSNNGRGAIHYLSHPEFEEPNSVALLFSKSRFGRPVFAPVLFGAENLGVKVSDTLARDFFGCEVHVITDCGFASYETVPRPLWADAKLIDCAKYLPPFRASCRYTLVCIKFIHAPCRAKDNGPISAEPQQSAANAIVSPEAAHVISFYVSR